ncbi:uncharacterized protein KIAA1958-like [Clytia hemisphaerica]|uniref:uncharacterized protein KIAA1958-like n=1 Tax=Clytia hemisphaerica TaxID=252671 RepID=UPI0034D54C60
MKRFDEVDEVKLHNLVLDKNSSNTKKATKSSYTLFKTYIEEKSILCDLQTVDKTGLNEILRKFYVEIRKKDGTKYSKSSLTAIRFGLQRKLNELRKDINIIDNKEFLASNEIFKAYCVELKKEGLAKTNHKPPIPPEDIWSIYNQGIFGLDNPLKLQRKVFFEIMLCMCRRGQENLRDLKKTDFVVKKDISGREYVEKIVDELTKNRRENQDAEEGGFMYATETDQCPVRSFKLYIEKLNPKCDALFQRPKAKVNEQCQFWYGAQVHGIINTISQFMKRISIDANLPTNYTNHSIRATSVTVLDNAGTEARHIMAVSGHRSESSIRSYSRTNIDRNDRKHRQFMTCGDNNDW